MDEIEKNGQNYDIQKIGLNRQNWKKVEKIRKFKKFGKNGKNQEVEKMPKIGKNTIEIRITNSDVTAK